MDDWGGIHVDMVCVHNYIRTFPTLDSNTPQVGGIVAVYNTYVSGVYGGMRNHRYRRHNRQLAIQYLGVGDDCCRNMCVGIDIRAKKMPNTIGITCLWEHNIF